MSFWRRSVALGYGFGTRIFHGLYDASIRKAKRLPVPVISVGNISMGGTGKTPTVHMLCREVLKLGLHPVILTRGYGGRQEGVLRGGLAGNLPATARDYGDEALMLSRSLPEVPVIVGGNRYQGARKFLGQGGQADVFFLDDGLQHRALYRDLDLVLLDPTITLADLNMFPMGKLRESIKALSRADCLLTLELGELGPHPSLPPGIPCFQGILRPRWVADLGDPNGRHSLAKLRQLRVHAVCGIANPKRFRATLKACGATLVGEALYRDHHPFSKVEIQGQEALALNSGATLITTEKDAVRIEPYAEASWLVLQMEIDLGDMRPGFLKRVLEPLGDKVKPRA